MIKSLTVSGLLIALFLVDKPAFVIRSSVTVDSLGAAQGVSCINGKFYLYGDREVGVIREYNRTNGELLFTGKQIKLAMNGNDVINHPTGIAYRPDLPVFIGNSIRLNTEGTKWRAVIYQVDWEGLKRTGKLDGNLISTIEDDACIQGTRPEYVQYKGKWYVASADYGGKSNEVRLYEVAKLGKAARTSAPGVLFKKFTCGPWVQNLHWVGQKGMLILVQNQVEGKKWRLSLVDLEESVNNGTASVIKVIDFENADELEGFSFTQSDAEGVAVTSSRSSNVHYVDISW